LVAARISDLPRFIDDVSSALANRIGSEPIDPEVKLATFVISGLVEVRIRSAFHHVDHVTSFTALNDAIERDFLQATRLAEPLLTALDAGRDPASASAPGPDSSSRTPVGRPAP
jgi:hypothetical protein